MLNFSRRLGGTLVLALAGLLAAEAYAQQARPITYNAPIQLQSARFNGNVWSNAQSRHRRDAAEVLVSDNAQRDKGGAAIYVLRKVGDIDDKGEVKFGDKFEIWSFFTAPGRPDNAGVFEDGRILSVVDDKHPQFGVGFNELVLYNSMAGDGPISTSFRLAPVESGKTGTVRAGDKFNLIASVLGKEAPLRVVKGSRYPTGEWNSVIVGGKPPQDADDPNAAVFTLQVAERNPQNDKGFDASKKN